MTEPGAPRRLPPPAWPVVAAIVVAVAGVGFLTGTRAPGPPTRAGVGAVPSSDAPMPRYAEMGRARRGASARMYDTAFDVLAAALPALTDPVQLGDRAAAVAGRAGRRAYDGAPPTIPHAIDQQGVPACLACHQRGAVIAGRVARAISHPAYASCVQCHVVARDPRPVAERSPPPENDFRGLASAGPGTRAWPGAPPTMPHALWMRDRCASCHGPAGDRGLATSHPTRLSCNQCHAPSAALEQRFPRPRAAARTPDLAGPTP